MIHIDVKTLITPEAYEKIEEKLRALFQDEHLEVNIEDDMTGNTVVVNMAEICPVCMEPSLFPHPHEEGLLQCHVCGATFEAETGLKLPDEWEWEVSEWGQTA